MYTAILLLARDCLEKERFGLDITLHLFVSVKRQLTITLGTFERATLHVHENVVSEFVTVLSTDLLLYSLSIDRLSDRRTLSCECSIATMYASE